MIAAMQVLKCQRPWKSSRDALDRLVQLALHLRAPPATSSAGTGLPATAGSVRLRIAHHEAIHAAQKALMPSMPVSCQSRSRSGGAANKLYMRVASAP